MLHHDAYSDIVVERESRLNNCKSEVIELSRKLLLHNVSQSTKMSMENYELLFGRGTKLGIPLPRPHSSIGSHLRTLTAERRLDYPTPKSKILDPPPNQATQPSHPSVGRHNEYWRCSR